MKINEKHIDWIYLALILLQLSHLLLWSRHYRHVHVIAWHHHRTSIVVGHGRGALHAVHVLLGQVLAVLIGGHDWCCRDVDLLPCWSLVDGARANGTRLTASKQSGDYQSCVYTRRPDDDGLVIAPCRCSYRSGGAAVSSEQSWIVAWNESQPANSSLSVCQALFWVLAQVCSAELLTCEGFDFPA